MLLRLAGSSISTMPPYDPFVPVERFIQRSLARLPAPISRWLGYRGKALPPSATWMICAYGFIGAFTGLSVILAIFGHTDYFRSRAVPPIVASFVSFATLCVIICTDSKTGRLCDSLLWRHRCPTCSTTIACLRSLLQRVDWGRCCNHLSIRS